MKKSFWERLKDGLRSFGDVIKEYPVTFAVLWILAIVTTLYSNNVFVVSDRIDPVESITIGLAIMCAQSIFVEEFLFGERRPEALPQFLYPIGEVIALIIAAFGTYLIKGLDSDIHALTVENSGKFFAVYCSCIVAVAIYHMFKRQEEQFETYSIKVCCGCFKCTIIYGLFAIGIAVIVLIFEELIADTGEFLLCSEQFLAMGVYGTMLLSVFCKSKEEISKFTRLVFIYVLQSLLLIAFAIIYIYIFKIIINMTIPSNEVFDILAFLFAGGMPVWTMSMAFNDTEYENKLTRLSQYIPYAFIPFIILQCICIGIRIGEYGVTLDRYMAVALIVFEVLYFVIYIIQRIKNKNIVGYTILLASVMAVVIVLVPFVNVFDVSVRSQMTRLTEMMQITEPTENQKGQMGHLYSTIKSMGEKGKKAIDDAFSEEEIACLKAYHDNNYYGGERGIYISVSETADPKNISGYKTITRVHSEVRKENGEQHCYLYNEEMENSIIIDGYVNVIVKSSENNDSEYQQFVVDEIYEIDDNTGFYCTYGNVSVENGEPEWESVSLGGYILSK